ncbi:DUF2254 domain-containing protein [Alteribacillus sp. YIM 98480]|uniref:DUF2254 domain-containing protein n=1 Tax=Alteribacillus sp. YIM 98480 TaxID=2606599 RepID=UPI00131E1B1E|nr:DUF2254 domain-containing protein [Alteribacillus sp. YIM 98480]
MSLKNILARVRSNFLYIPSLYGIAALLLAIASIQIDTHIMSIEYLHRFIPDSLFMDIDLAQTILGSISAALLTMTTITFSTILVVLTTYISEFSPRTLQNFISDPNTQRVLGCFIAGIIYSILLLLLIRETEMVTHFIAPSFAVLFAIICIFVFVYFIHHVSSWIQVSSLLHYITRSTIEKIDKEFKKETEIEADDPWDDWESEDIKHIDPRIIRAEHSGYIQNIDIEGMVKQAQKDDCIVRINANINDYIEKGGVFLSMWELDTPNNPKTYHKFISIGPERSSKDTVEIAVTKITEIALRALSSGINDPNTAVNCIENLGKVLSHLGSKHLPRAFHNDEQRQLRVIMEKPDFSDYLYKCFYQIRQHGFKDISVLSAGLKALGVIAANNSDKIKDVVYKFTEYIMEGIDQESLLSWDKDYINRQLEELYKVCGHSSKFTKL